MGTRMIFIKKEIIFRKMGQLSIRLYSDNGTKFNLNLTGSFMIDNRLVSQMRETLADSREPAEKLWQLCKV